MRSVLVLLPLLALTACPWGRHDREVDSVTPELAAVVEGNTAFAVDMYGWVAAGDEGNLFFSPFSMSSALSMTYAGAEGDTESEMAAVLHVTGDEADWHEAFGALTQDLSGDYRRGYTLNIANRLFGQEDFAWKDTFLEVQDRDYDAPLEELDYQADPEAARVHINEWVADQTEDLIEDLLQPGVIDTDTRLVLANAIYFLGRWQSIFLKKDTEDQTFHAPGGDISAPLMQQNGHFDLATHPEAELAALRLPYLDDEVSMVVLLPDEDDGLAELEAALTPEALEAWTAGFERQEVHVVLPRVEMRYRLSVTDALSDLGMPTAFDREAADFTGMHDEPEAQLFVSDVVHEAFVRVDEEGTEAAAATGTTIIDLTGPSEPFEFVADHPYLFVIRDDLTGSILFMGRVVDPTAS